MIDKALKSSEHTSKDWDSYIFRIINLTNKNSDLNALSGLGEIRKLIFSNVKNLNSTEEAFQVALLVLDVILNNLDVNIENPQEEENEDGESQEISVDGGDGDGDEDGSDDRD